MTHFDEKIPNPKDLEREIGEFLTRKFGDSVKLVSPIVLPHEAAVETDPPPSTPAPEIRFDLKPEELVAYLDRYMVKQEEAKAILATKICTHFNRIKQTGSRPAEGAEMVGRIKNNVLMIGPTGVGKTYMIKLIAARIGVPFVKGDATKFSETGYVGGDVEDLVRDLVREADGDIDRAQHGIIYIDEIDKIAGSRNFVGADVSRTGVQRALLKPLEETEVDLKVPHDPISMIEEIERFRKTGKKEKRTVNTRNILFIVSGAFTDLVPIIRKRVAEQGIGFGAALRHPSETDAMLKRLRSEDLIEFGFESEFVGRLPVRAVFDRLTEEDLFQILKNPNNPIILGKKLDFAAYGISAKFDDRALRVLAKRAFEENTGARGLVSAVENALLLFERKLPSSDVTLFPVTGEVVENAPKAIERLLDRDQREATAALFERLAGEEHRHIRSYLRENVEAIEDRYGMPPTPARFDIIATLYGRKAMDIGRVIGSIRKLHDEIKSIELLFFKNQDINIVFEDDAVDYIIEQCIQRDMHPEDYYQQFLGKFEHGLRLIREKTGRNRFFITRQGLVEPERFVAGFLAANGAAVESTGKAS